MNRWRVLLPLAGIFLAAALRSGIAAQSAAPPPPPAPAMPVSPAEPTAIPPAVPAKQSAAQQTANPTKAPKKHKVFTDDDVPALRAKGGLANDDDAGSAMIYGSTGNCDADCEQKIKKMVGIAPEQEGEWKLQITAARREVGEDRQWRELYWKGQQTMHNFCALQTQEQKAVQPRGDDYQSRLERDSQLKAFGDAEHSINQQLQNSLAGMNHYIQQFSNREPVRAAFMGVTAEHLFRTCPDTNRQWF
ncbi:MAG: hypothetical protein WCB14_18550 [Candidatus Acidiferrales bacterium]